MLRAFRTLALAESLLQKQFTGSLPQSFLTSDLVVSASTASQCTSGLIAGAEPYDHGRLYGRSSGVHRSLHSQAEIWTWGKGEEGQLGHATEDVEKKPRRVDTLVHTTNPSVNSEAHSGKNNEFRGEVSCGLFHTAALLEGKLFMWGKGHGGRLGIGDDQARYQPLRLPLDDVSSVALGGLHSLAVTKDGRAWGWGFGMFGALGRGAYANLYEPTLIQGPWEKQGDKVVAVAGGGAHSAAVTESGALYTWGRDEAEGRLGVSDVRFTGGSPSPLRVQGIEGRVMQAACGGFHTLCLTDDGQVWSFGANGNGELGRESKKGDPQPIEALQGRRMRKIACGGYHSAAITEDGVMLTWGYGGHAQLGHRGLSSEREPREVESLRGSPIRTLACGGNWTSAVTEDGRIFTWGKNRDWQLGRGLPLAVDMEPVPGEVELPRMRDSLSRTAVDISSGAHHGIALVIAEEGT